MVRVLLVSCASRIFFTAPKYMIKNINERQVPQKQEHLTHLQPIPYRTNGAMKATKIEANNHHFKSFFALSTSILHRCNSNASSHMFKPLLSCPFSNCRVILELLLALWSERIIHFDKCGCLLRRITVKSACMNETKKSVREKSKRTSVNYDFRAAAIVLP
jgi:hypothetical protein